MLKSEQPKMPKFEQPGPPSSAAPKGKLKTVYIERLDRSFAQGVREKPNETAVEQYAEAEKNEVDLPEVTVFGFEGRHLFLADGEHRVLARLKLGRHSIKARVVECESVDAARTQARFFAAGANATHGLQRSPEDKCLAVRSVIGHPVLASTSNRMVARICHVSHALVAKIRREMTASGELTGPAAVATDAGTGTRRVGAIRNYRGGYTLLADGRLLTNEEADRLMREEAPDRVNEWLESPGCNLPTLPPAGIRRSMNGNSGQTIPEHLAPIFAEGKKFVRDYGKHLNDAYHRFWVGMGEPWGESLPPVHDELKAAFVSLLDRAWKNVPHCVCPCQSATPHPAGFVCRVCKGGRGWLSESEYEAWMKCVADQRPADKGERTA